MATKKLWYEEDWGIFLLLLIFPPAGLYLLWTNKSYSFNSKVIFTVCYVLVSFAVAGVWNQ